MVVDAEPAPGGGAWARWRRLFSRRRMSAVPPTTERTGTDLSRCLAGGRPSPAAAAANAMGIHGHGQKEMKAQRPKNSAAASASTLAVVPTSASASAATERNGRKRWNSRCVGDGRPQTWIELWQDDRFLSDFFLYLPPMERCTMAQVCVKWRDVIYEPRFWRSLSPILRCRELRCKPTLRKTLYDSMQRRGFDSVCLVDATDDDIHDVINNYPPCVRSVLRVSLRCSAVSDKGLETLLEQMQNASHLELSGCNEITEAGLWACLTPRLSVLTIADCINVADESMSAVAQLLPTLRELNLQAYHVTDAALGYFSAKQAASLRVLRLRSCWEVTNHGLVNIVHALPNLTVLSVSGCSKITDDGVELIAENLRHLRSLDLSWCPRITDAALEYIACDLAYLEELTLDRCVHITDIGVGYVSTLTSMTSLFLRWCSQIRDFGLQHLCSMRKLQVLSLAGCSLLTSSGLSSLIQLRNLQELELTNCPGVSRELFDYLHEHLSKCLIIE